MGLCVTCEKIGKGLCVTCNKWGQHAGCVRHVGKTQSRDQLNLGSWNFTLLKFGKVASILAYALSAGSPSAAMNASRAGASESAAVVTPYAT